MARSTLEYEQDILDGLHWLGLEWDEGPEVAGLPARGPYGPYRQMQRLDRYAAGGRAAARRGQGLPLLLHARGAGRRQAAQEAAHQPPHYVGRCARLTPDERAAARPRAASRSIRFRVGEGVVDFDDIVRGHVEIDTSALGGDLVIVRSDGTPLYHFTVVVDDTDMAISHVIRGEDHLSNTPKHILLFQALGADVPQFAHLPLILNPDRTKMSKRKTQTAVADYRAQGYIREAFVNFLALLGWSSGTERGDLHARRAGRALRARARPVGRRGLRRERLEWLNGQWIRKLPTTSWSSARCRSSCRGRRARRRPAGAACGRRRRRTCAP